jgi:hypothetical protein
MIKYASAFLYMYKKKLQGLAAKLSYFFYLLSQFNVNLFNILPADFFSSLKEEKYWFYSESLFG